MSNTLTSLDKRQARLLARIGADKRKTNRVSLDLDARFMAENGWEYPCDIIDISPGGIRIASEYPVRNGHHIILMSSTLGRLEGYITRVLEDGFAMSILATSRKQDRLADQITWLLNKKRLDLHEERRGKRTIKKARVYIRTQDGLRFCAHSRDLSLSGMSVETHERLKIGERLQIGNLTGTVTRRHDKGFCIRFDVPEHPDDHEKEQPGSIKLESQYQPIDPVGNIISS